jgi:hypothetical protein
MVIGAKNEGAILNAFSKLNYETRVATERVSEAQQIAVKYQDKLITCDIGDDTWKYCVEKEHSMQVLLQL